MATASPSGWPPSAEWQIHRRTLSSQTSVPPSDRNSCLGCSISGSHAEKTLPLNLMRQSFREEALPGSWGLLIVTHPWAFPGGKHGTVFPDQTWTLPRGSQTRCLACTNISTSDWTARPGSVFPWLYFTNVCVFLPAPLGKLPCFMASCR